ncbi:MAG: cytochrome c oxidase subunit II [Betaproteobacteria bacterium]|nr:cytochrome c oxidase subunit II [Betaproteobacteria bacterium]
MGINKKTQSCLAGLALMGWSVMAQAAWEFNFQVPATKAAQTVIDLHNLMMIVIMIIFIGVFAVMFYSVFKHRKSKGHQAAQFHDNTMVEIAWTVVPLLILVAMAWPATKALLNMRDTAQADITIKATGYQWKWGYDYLKGEGEGIRFISLTATPADQVRGTAPKGENYLLEVDRHLVVPVGKKIRMLTTATDVIHSWWVPALAVKQDAIPGYVRDTWFKAEKEGIYRGQCAELCGKDHAFMPIVVEVVSAEKYATWVEAQKKQMSAAADEVGKTYSLEELKSRGEKVYAANCVACHQANGKGLPPAFPALDGSKLAKGPMKDHVNIVLNGKPNTAMAAYGGQLGDGDIAAVVTYERNAWGNKTGDMVQPADIKAARK